MHETITVTLAQLELSPRNIRTHVGDATDVASLAASIRSVGLLQPLIVSKKPGRNKKYLVEAGGRRLRALEQLASEGHWPADLSIGVTLLAETGNVTEISLAENYARTQMRQYEIYKAFARIAEERPGATLEEIGAMFGYDSARAARVMRLARLAPTVMEAYALGQLDDAQAQAFAATEDHAVQAKVFKDLWQSDRPTWHREARSIRSELKVNSHDHMQLLKMVGLETYQAAGGKFESDLFGEGGRVTDPALLESLLETAIAKAKATFETKLVRNGRKLSAEWGLADMKVEWADEPPQIVRYGNPYPDTALRADIDLAHSADNKLRADALEAEMDEIEDHDEQERYNELQAELELLEAAADMVLPEGEGLLQLVLDARDLDVDVYFATYADAGREVPVGATPVAAQPAAPAEPVDPADPAPSQRALDYLRAERVRMALRHVTGEGAACEGTRHRAHLALVFYMARALLIQFEAGPHKSGLVYNAAGGSYQYGGCALGIPEDVTAELSLVPGLTDKDPLAGFRWFEANATHAEVDLAAAVVFASKVDGHHQAGATLVDDVFTDLAIPFFARKAWLPEPEFFDLWKKSTLHAWGSKLSTGIKNHYAKAKTDELKRKLHALVDPAQVKERADLTKFSAVSDAELAIGATWVPKWLRWHTFDEIEAARPTPLEQAVFAAHREADADELADADADVEA